MIIFFIFLLTALNTLTCLLIQLPYHPLDNQQFGYLLEVILSQGFNFRISPLVA
ncbi:hypothetical protein EMIT079MI2_70152 [Bacillus sp. IT-79MI2]